MYNIKWTFCELYIFINIIFITIVSAIQVGLAYNQTQTISQTGTVLSGSMCVCMCVEKTMKRASEKEKEETAKGCVERVMSIRTDASHVRIKMVLYTNYEY